LRPQEVKADSEMLDEYATMLVVYLCATFLCCCNGTFLVLFWGKKFSPNRNGRISENFGQEWTNFFEIRTFSDESRNPVSVMAVIRQ
jgi:hypothetical protein